MATLTGLEVLVLSVRVDGLTAPVDAVRLANPNSLKNESLGAVAKALGVAFDANGDANEQRNKLVEHLRSINEKFFFGPR